FAAAVVRAVRKAGLTARVSVQSFDWRTLVIMRRVAPEIERVCLTIDGGNGDTLQRGRPGASPWTAGLDIDDFAGSAPRLVPPAWWSWRLFWCGPQPTARRPPHRSPKQRRSASRSSPGPSTSVPTWSV